MTRCIRRLAGLAALLSVSVGAWSAAVGAAPSRQPAPAVSGPVTGGTGVNLIGPDVSSAGYVREEYFLEGSAVNFQPAGRLGTDGRWSVEKAGTAPYKTRFVVWKPADPADFNGTVFVEWLNVSPGFDNPPDWLNAHNQIVRSGAAWVGVSAQAASVNGGNVIQAAGAPPPGGLRAADPARYATLEHPGDAFSYDIFTQAGDAVRGDGKGARPFEGYDVKRVIALGESQSAFRMTTYVNAIHPRAKVYDGFLIHSRGGQAAPFGEQQLGQVPPGIPRFVRIRRDVDVPVFTLETETDLVFERLGFTPARQPDFKHFRLWEVAGTAHADAYLGGGPALSDLGDGSAEVALLDPTQGSGGRLGCATAINAGAQYAVIGAALAQLERWVRTGTPPPKAPRIVTTGSGSATKIVRDEHGIARGGVRTPIVDAPIATNDGEQNRGPSFCLLFGHMQPFDAATLARLYPRGRDDYVAAFDKAVDKAVKAGIWLRADGEHYKAAARQVPFG
jgi:hypothetical protein